jgi:hypothetical protein
MDRHSDRHHVVNIQLGCTNGAGESTSSQMADGMGGGMVPALQPPASKEGKIGEYWYHGDTAAYNHDEEQHQEQEARDDRKKTRPPRYHIWVRAPSK